MNKQLLLLLTCVVLLFTESIANTWPLNDNIRVQVCRRTEQTIRLMPTASANRTLSVMSDSKTTLHFYVFDVEGTMVYHTELPAGARAVVEGLQKGVYSYDVFRNDQGVEQGKITVQ